jgi:hypothetical protein
MSIWMVFFWAFEVNKSLSFKRSQTWKKLTHVYPPPWSKTHNEHWAANYAKRSCFEFNCVLNAKLSRPHLTIVWLWLLQTQKQPRKQLQTIFWHDMKWKANFRKKGREMLLLFHGNYGYLCVLVRFFKK